MCRKELGGAAKFRDGRRPSCCGELREAVIVHFADGGLSFSCWETRVLDKKRRYRTLARYDEQDRDPERLNPRPEREAGVVVRRICGRHRATSLPILSLNAAVRAVRFGEPLASPRRGGPHGAAFPPSYSSRITATFRSSTLTASVFPLMVGRLDSCQSSTAR